MEAAPARKLTVSRRIKVVNRHFQARNGIDCSGGLQFQVPVLDDQLLDRGDLAEHGEGVGFRFLVLQVKGEFWTFQNDPLRPELEAKVKIAVDLRPGQGNRKAPLVTGADLEALDMTSEMMIEGKVMDVQMYPGDRLQGRRQGVYGPGRLHEGEQDRRQDYGSGDDEHDRDDNDLFLHCRANPGEETVCR